MEVNIFTKGLNQDISEKYQEEGTYRFALNSVLETSEGESPSISNEMGTTECSINFPSSKRVIGSAITDSDETILFLYDPAGDHEVGIISPMNCTYTTLIHGGCLNFSDKYPINAIVKIREGCNRVVYFTDNYNEYRVLDIDDLNSYVEPSDPTILSCPRLLYSKDFFKPCVFMYEGISNSGIEDNAGGELEIGVYYFAVRFLDSKLNPTPWTTITRGIAIADEPFKHTLDPGTINLYDGGSNIETSPHYVQKTDKALLFNITGTNGLFEYYQVAVIKRTGDAGEISGVDILKPQPWENGSVRFVYNGDPNKVERVGTLEEILISPLQIDKVKAHAIKDGRLFLGNTSFTQRDYSTYQRYASKIKTEWVKTAVTNAANSGVRQGNYYNFNGSFMDDEIYPWGIVYVHDDGEISPVMHIPGRAPNMGISANATNPFIGSNGTVSVGSAPWDTGVGAYGNANTSLPDQARWRYISTAFQYGNGNLTGLMGYHECTSETYPEIQSCDDHPDGYWGRDWQGNLIEAGVTKIRHHRMPGPELRESAQAAENFRLGVKFSNVEYPAEDIVGHFFVYGDREFDKTIQAKGVFIPVVDDPNNTILDIDDLKPRNYNVPLLLTNYLFISATNLIQDKIVVGDYFRTEKVLRDMNFETGGINSIKVNTTNSWVTDEPNNDNAENILETTIRYFTRYNVPASGELINNIRANIFALKTYEGAKKGTETYEPNSQVTILNNSINTSFQFVSTNSGPQTSINTASGNWLGKMYFGSIKTWKNVFNDLFSIRYKRTNNCIAVASSPAASFIHYGGDTAVNRVSFVDYTYRQEGLPPGNIKFHTNAIYTSFPSQDSNLNYEFRHGSTFDVKETYFQYKNAPSMATNHNHFVQYLDRKRYLVSGNPSDGGVWSIYPETYNYNNSYSYLDGIEIFYPIQFNYDFCNPCIEDHPYRIYYSEIDNQETTQDFSRIVYSNNYQDLNGLSGEITDLFVNFDKLYATTLNSVFLIPVNTQTIQTDLSTVYLGTSSTLAIPAQELKNTAYGFGGQMYFKSRVNTEYGTFYVDSASKRPILLSSQIEDISLSGMRNFWQENAEVQFETQFFQLTGEYYNIKSTSSPIGVGYISTYDPRYKRIIVHKRDFKLREEWQSSFVYEPQGADAPAEGNNTPNIVWFNGYNFYYNDKNGNYNLIDFSSVDHFENLSFTLSFAFTTRHWISFHSYLPSYLFNTTQTFFSQDLILGEGKLFRHMSGNYQTYYSKKYPHIVDLIYKQNPLEGKLSSSVVFTSRTSEYSPNNKAWKFVPKTFTSFVAYNSTQTTGEQNLEIKDSPLEMDFQTDTALVKLTDNNWRLNNIRDNTVDKQEPVWDSSWLVKASFPYSYIDKVPNGNNIDLNKNMFEQARLRDHFMGLRLKFDAPENYKIVTDAVTVTQQNRNR